MFDVLSVPGVDRVSYQLAVAAVNGAVIALAFAFMTGLLLILQTRLLADRDLLLGDVIQFQRPSFSLPPSPDDYGEADSEVDRARIMRRQEQNIVLLSELVRQEPQLVGTAITPQAVLAALTSIAFNYPVRRPYWADLDADSARRWLEDARGVRAQFAEVKLLSQRVVEYLRTQWPPQGTVSVNGQPQTGAEVARVLLEELAQHHSRLEKPLRRLKLSRDLPSRFWVASFYGVGLLAFTGGVILPMFAVWVPAWALLYLPLAFYAVFVGYLGASALRLSR